MSLKVISYYARAISSQINSTIFVLKSWLEGAHSEQQVRRREPVVPTAP